MQIGDVVIHPDGRVFEVLDCVYPTILLYSKDNGKLYTTKRQLKNMHGYYEYLPEEDEE